MRRLILATLLGILISSNVGCFLPAYSADPARRARQLIYTSENLRGIQDEWERFWFLDQPDHQKAHHIHGGLI